MKSQRLIIILLIAFFVGGLGSIFFNRFLIPQLSAVRGFMWLSNLRSDTPIVITHREEVQLNEGANFIELTKQAQGITVSIFHARDPKLLGNGIIMTTDGLIWTMKEVVGNQQEFRAVLNDGRIFPAVLRALDPLSESAVLTIPANNLPVASFSDASNMQTAQRVFAIGKTDREFVRKASSGLVSKTVSNAAQPEKVYSTEIYDQSLETDARLNSDFVGGPVINLEGRVVGMVANSSGKILISEVIQPALRSYLESGKITRPIWGFSYLNVTKLTAGIRGLSSGGALVTDVTNLSAAAKAGLVRNDLIIEVAGQRIEDSNLERLLLGQSNSSEVKLVVLRNNNRQEITIKTERR